jgi:mono/diheme cytochrome c family protein
MKHIGNLLLAMGVVMLGGLPSRTAAAQNVTYTEAQATQGAAAFRASCMSCHGDRGQGGEGPALVGPQFDANWRGGPAKDLYAYVTEFMPADKPQSLSRDTYIVLVAHILKMNNVPAGEQPLVASPPGNIPK